MRMIKFEDKNKSHAAASVTQWLRFGFCSTSTKSNQIHYPRVESPWCDNGWQASRASLDPAGPSSTPMPLKWDMTHQTLVTASWLPLACSEYSSWKLHWWAHDLFNTCWYILHSNSLNASVRFTAGKGSSSRDLDALSSLNTFWMIGFALPNTAELWIQRRQEVFL